MTFEEIVNRFKENNKLQETFHNTYINAYTFNYSYKYKNNTQYMLFVIMENEGKWQVLQTSFKKEFWKNFQTLEELQEIYEKFMEFAKKNRELVLN